jgi:hypothetical protein
MHRLITNSLMATLLAGSALLVTGAPALAAESSSAAVSSVTARPDHGRGNWHCHWEWNGWRHEWQRYCHHHRHHHGHGHHHGHH